MVLHISLNGECTDLINTYTIKLCKFFSKKAYKTRTVILPLNDAVKYILKNYNLMKHEKAQIQAFDRSFAYYLENWENYDIIIWNNNIIQDYHELTDENTPQNYITKINNYFPTMDIYITITKEQKYQKTLKNHHIIEYTNTDDTFTRIVETCFDNLPKCNWCPRLFKPSKHYKKYCSDKCKEASYEEQQRVNNRRYYHRYKDVMTEKQKGGLGSKNANLHGTADPNPLRELEKVRNAKRSLGLKPIQ